ncbi:TIGR02281 family clan AA aspartic protease [Tianweitania sediminis]|uniref:TIGR02281 family clan AA aspartic protease n=1 Tax=Tianweitania sediminis TaxID=1502156 RepID=A0A8J7R4R6_9HYPH|nr:TIGR02281 family clan AA aspartic protease [Tianweitania sediminis]
MRRRPPQLLWIILAVLAGGLVLLVLNHDAGTTFGLDNDAFAHLLRTGVLLTVFSVAIVASRGRFGHLARNFAIWCVILLLLTTGYLYRYELQDVANRLSAGLVPGSPLSTLSDNGRPTVTIGRSANNHFEARGRINGTPVRLLIDTGASTTVLTTSDAEAVGIDVASLTYNVAISTANGTSLAARAPAGTIEIGDITRSRVPMLVARAGGLSRSLLGMNFMGTLSGYDVRGDRMILRD